MKYERSVLGATRSKLLQALLLTTGLVAACQSHQPETQSPTLEATGGATAGVGLYNASPHLASIFDAGTWAPAPQSADEESPWELIGGWVDARIANTRYHKRIFVEVDVPYDNGTRIRTLHPATYRGPLPDGYERWGTDTVAIYVNGGPLGAHQKGGVGTRLRIQHDADGDGRDEMLVTSWQTLYGEGDYQPNISDPWPPDLTSPVHSTQPASTEVYFAPFDDPGKVILDEVHEVIARQRNNPTERQTIHAAVFNLSDPEIIDALIAAHQIGVEVRLVTDGRKLRPWAHWLIGDDLLAAAGVPLLGLMREEDGAMHSKIGLFNGRTLVTGSANWQPGARYANHENLLATNHVDLISAYARRFEAIAGGVLNPRSSAHDPHLLPFVGFCPDEAPYQHLGHLLDQATQSIHVAMFTAKFFDYDEHGARQSLFDKLASAAERGVEVILITDFGIAESDEYYGVISEDDPTDEWLEDRGVHVVRANNTFQRYASMHHKFAVIDEAVAITGAFNWYYDAAFSNDEDLLFLNDSEVITRYREEIGYLLHKYAPRFSAQHQPTNTIEVSAFHDRTTWGDSVLVVGNLPELGAWNPADGIELNPARWPDWRGEMELPLGARFEWKLALRRPDGTYEFEAGHNRRSQSRLHHSTLRVNFRR